MMKPEQRLYLKIVSADRHGIVKHGRRRPFGDQVASGPHTYDALCKQVPPRSLYNKLEGEIHAEVREPTHPPIIRCTLMCAPLFPDDQVISRIGQGKGAPASPLDMTETLWNPLEIHSPSSALPLVWTHLPLESLDLDIVARWGFGMGKVCTRGEEYGVWGMIEGVWQMRHPERHHHGQRVRNHQVLC